jgi:hypothetical protein
MQRKLWLFATICLACYPVMYLIMHFLAAQVDLSSQQTLRHECSKMVVILAGLGTIIYCAYSNPGIRLLSLGLGSICLRVLKMGTNLLQATEDMLSVVVLAMILSEIAIMVWWCILSWKLRKINQLLQKYRRPKEYVEALQGLKEAASLETLSARYSILIDKWPQFEPVSSQEYSAIKEQSFSKKNT